MEQVHALLEGWCGLHGASWQTAPQVCRQHTVGSAGTAHWIVPPVLDSLHSCCQPVTPLCRLSRTAGLRVAAAAGRGVRRQRRRLRRAGHGGAAGAAGVRGGAGHQEHGVQRAGRQCQGGAGSTGAGYTRATHLLGRPGRDADEFRAPLLG